MELFKYNQFYLSLAVTAQPAGIISVALGNCILILLSLTDTIVKSSQVYFTIRLKVSRQKTAKRFYKIYANKLTILGCRISSFVFMEHVTLIHGIALKT